ncbi:MAG: hypothetical protein QNK37_02620 [Acidobacteriota bacterium]|nr:hypothetical protein [Acidobacteriota bacterium]
MSEVCEDMALAATPGGLPVYPCVRPVNPGGLPVYPCGLPVNKCGRGQPMQL